MKIIDLIPCREAGGGGTENTSNVPDCIRFATWNIGTMTRKPGISRHIALGIKDLVGLC